MPQRPLQCCLCPTPVQSSGMHCFFPFTSTCLCYVYYISSSSLSPYLPFQPSLTILQSFVNSCNQEKIYSWLAVTVKRARESGLCLEKVFYQRALVLLRQWGQDQSAISTIYKALRTIDTVSPGSSTYVSETDRSHCVYIYCSLCVFMLLVVLSSYCCSFTEAYATFPWQYYPSCTWRTAWREWQVCDQ